jgi:hypothetical protein
MLWLLCRVRRAVQNLQQRQQQVGSCRVQQQDLLQLLDCPRTKTCRLQLQGELPLLRLPQQQ